MEFNEEHIEALLKDLTPSPPSPSPWQAEIITIEDDATPADPITIDDESNCDLQQKEVNQEDIEKMKIEEDDSDSEDEGSLGLGPDSPSTRADVRLAWTAVLPQDHEHLGDRQRAQDHGLRRALVSSTVSTS
ncbi:hypothetical protein E4U19_005835 [Claviceps sp. Clav32 group G5]|nr:hypothetical protein E4U19_005835 [Claviceps sp. Clav32 group G5]